jgi:DeoR/GlpR family transcriptional regulator of sugar metabolism
MTIVQAYGDCCRAEKNWKTGFQSWTGGYRWHTDGRAHLLEAKVNRVMVEVAKRTVAVCDSSKFGRRSLSLIVPTSALQEVITDRGAPKSELSVLKRARIEVTLV